MVTPRSHADILDGLEDWATDLVYLTEGGIKVRKGERERRERAERQRGGGEEREKRGRHRDRE